ncbi:UNKNOWN [Stylonychia lemnae]|uniref:Uncharacterized protein n=1 Tax=Stylonychia lemnae TaxID=5949 RepID=A0A078ANE6_STYLE|nr:UNKNOWN [Stylonychia lemnae]|eukprot:CDW82862.1 UNKNOWN [Stylonychia lemnae]
MIEYNYDSPQKALYTLTNFNKTRNRANLSNRSYGVQYKTQQSQHKINKNAFNRTFRYKNDYKDQIFPDLNDARNFSAHIENDSTNSVTNDIQRSAQDLKEIIEQKQNSITRTREKDNYYQKHLSFQPVDSSSYISDMTQVALKN